MISTGGAALAAGISALAGTVGAGLNAYSANMANKWNRREADKNRKWQEEMWNKQNEYNLPVNQLQRIKAAGLNPNLVFGQNGMSTQGASFGGNVSNPQMTSPQYGDMLKGVGSAIQMYQQYRMKQAELDLLESQKKKTDNEAAFVASQTVGQDWQNSYNQTMEDVKKAVEEQALTNSKHEGDRIVQVISNMKSAQSKTEEEITNLQNEGRIQTAQWNRLTWDLAESISTFNKRVDFLDAQIQEKVWTAFNQRFQGKLAESGIEVSKAQASYLYQMVENLKNSKTLDDVKKELVKAQKVLAEDKHNRYEFDKAMEIWQNVNGTIGEIIPFILMRFNPAAGAGAAAGKMMKDGRTVPAPANQQIKTRSGITDMYGNPY